jgi:hypothetical protein
MQHIVAHIEILLRPKVILCRPYDKVVNCIIYDLHISRLYSTFSRLRCAHIDSSKELSSVYKALNLEFSIEYLYSLIKRYVLNVTSNNIN